jgi:NADH-quinone oxidoreductase subunit L
MNLFENMENIYLAIVLAPLVGAIIAGMGGKLIGRNGAHRVTILAVGISSVLSLIAYYNLFYNGG